MKMQEGKDEEEAIQDFGDFNELVDEIREIRVRTNADNPRDAKLRKFWSRRYRTL